MADLRTRFIEDYAGGLLNIARQELSSTGEVLAQDGFVDNTTLFVEDGRGVKSGLRLGSSLAECVDPTTEIGLLNVRTADRTYAKIRDLKSFATAVASAQGALSDSVATSLTNLEGAFESLETDVETYRTQLTELIDNSDLGVGNLTLRVEGTEAAIVRIDATSTTISNRITTIETEIDQINTTSTSLSGQVTTIEATLSQVEVVVEGLALATSSNITDSVVKRDSLGNFSAGTITAALTGAASSNVLKTGDTMTGALLVDDGGTAALPAIAFDGDPNTGIFRPGADQVAISTGGTSRLFVDSTGSVAIGGTGAAGVTLYNQKAITGAVLAAGNQTVATVQSDVTTGAGGYATYLSTAATSFTLPALVHFAAAQGTLGAGSSITAQYGFAVDASLTGATNNFGFISYIASATGRWNFYAYGTAPNWFAGDVRTNTAFTARTVPANSNTSATATASSLLDGLRTGTPTGNITLTLPTGTDMDSAFQDLQANQSFEWSVINLAAATHLITVTAAATGHTVVGNMAVAAATSGRFITRKTAANTFISYRIA